MHLKRFIPYATIFLLIETLLRLTLLGRAMFDVEFGRLYVVDVMLRGLWFDIVTGSFFMAGIAFFWLVLPTARIAEIVLRFLFCFTLLFDAVAEHLFWSEFTTRFNFIAVDYLVYTQEVIGNIVESYPLYPLLAGIFVGAAGMTWLSLRYWPVVALHAPFKRRAAVCGTVLAASIALLAISSPEQAAIEGNAEAQEVAANGMYNLFSAFRHNEISYSRFYSTRPDRDITNNARNLLFEHESNFVHPEGDDLTRHIKSRGGELHRNVVVVVMESMSADYMGTFGNKENLTPNLDQLAREGLLFSDLYATGTRTVRGLEAVTLSIPPTPGQSIIRRPGNENLFSLGFVFKDRGYDTSFLYGGYGYFDNMSAFFAGNGFNVIDRTGLAKEEIQFANVWGVCDEDIFARAVRDADHLHASGKPFLQLIMTTSNHRPYTYPEGRIDIPSHSNRLGGVKYADYSIGKLVEQARTKPWFKNTVFVFVADHTAGAGGKAELDPHKYHIPMIFYAPGFIKPSRYEKVASQIDLAPVLLGLLHFNYYTKFFGEDLLHDDDEVSHAFISNYQKIALVKHGEMVVLSPKSRVEAYSWPDSKAKAAETPDVEDAIAYYQSASWWKEHYRRIPTVVH